MVTNSLYMCLLCFDNLHVYAYSTITLLVGHVPCNLTSLFIHFLARDVSKGFSTVSAAPVNRGPRMGMEVPRVYKLYCSSRYLERITSFI